MRGAGQGALRGTETAGGVTNYFEGSGARWRAGVPRFAAVRVHNLYRNVDVSYYFRDERLEFDLHLRPGADSRKPRFDLRGATHLALESSGSLTIDVDGNIFRFHTPLAYQVKDGKRTPVECRYQVDAKHGVGFLLGKYDRSRELIVDPVVEFLTYLGGSGIDQIQAIGVDQAGNVVVAGITNSTNFPGGGAPAGSVSIFVTKLNSTGSAALFTTILGARQTSVTSYFVESVSSLAVDSDGSIYVTGVTYSSNFPTSAGAWQQNSTGGFLTKLNSGGQLVYSTFLGPQTWGLTALRVRARNGTAYLAGNLSAAQFLGSSGAYQRDLAGGTDFFALAMAPDGSGPVFATAFGGSGNESLSDMALDGSGNIVLVGTSTSPDLPLTADALPYGPPMANSVGAVMVRLDPTGSNLISSTWLGTSSAAAVTGVPDGSLVVAGPSVLPADLISGSPHYAIDYAGSASHSYIAKFPATSNRPLWTTDLVSQNNYGSGISADMQGNLYRPGYPDTASGGALQFYIGLGVSKLSADGSHLLYASSIPGSFSSLTAVSGPGGGLYFSGYTGATLPTTPGVIQPSLAPSSSASTPNPYDGFAGVLDLSSFTDNFFVIPPLDGISVTWRIGEPAPAPVAIPIQFSGSPVTLSATPSSRLSAAFSLSPSPAVTVNANTSQSIAGTFQESVSVQSQANPNALLAMPVTVTVQPHVSFTLASSQVDIQFRQGQAHTPSTVTITPNFGSESFYLSVTSSAWWLSGYVSENAQTFTLYIDTFDQSPGTYTGALTVSIQGLQNANATVQVKYIVDPPATIQLSAQSVALHVVMGQPVTPAVVNVTSSVTGVAWSVFVGVSATWLQVTETNSATPGAIQITVDPATAQVGYWQFNAFVSGENNQRVTLPINVDISSGAPLDATPNSITYEYLRGGTSPYPQTQTIAFTTSADATVQFKASQSWISPQSGSVKTPAIIDVAFDDTLPEGVYQGNITASAGSYSVAIPITWQLYNMPHLVFSSNPIGFQWQTGDPPPAAQQIQVTSPTLLPDYIQVGVASIPGFLKASPAYGPTPVTVTLTVDPTGLTPGVYTTNLSIQGSYPDSTLYPWIPVTLTVLLNPNAPKATVARVTDAASYLGGAVSPGEAVVLFGSGLGPAALHQAQPDASGYPATLAGWTVNFDEFAAPILYLSNNQLAVMVPFGIAGRVGTSLTVTTGGSTSAALSLPVSATNPSVFTADASGSGLAAAVNVAADGLIGANTAASPASRGSVVTMYATGLGTTTPAMNDGSLAGAPLPQLNAPVQVLIGGITATVLYAGPAPGLIAGLTQINLQIPANATTGMAPLLVVSGGNASQPGVTLAIQ
jgi:uncharacterized protein (TIGR03437 family)